MIRIDEIYNNTFWPFIQKHIPNTRMFYCDPPGRSDPESLMNFENATHIDNYILFHDQEPIHLDIHQSLFQSVITRNSDITPVHRSIITSEYDSDFVSKVCSQFNWKAYYYFYHGWAALDWFRGYNYSYTMLAPRERSIQKSFISPNRIIGGKRQHRITLMYLLLQRKIKNAWISFPQTCPAENVHINDIVPEYMKQTFVDADLPWNFPGEFDHPMHSCWLSLFDESAESLAYVVTETVFTGRRHHLTEKTFKPICLGMPFVLVSTAGSLEYLRRYGFKTFESIWDESYDLETDDTKRLDKIADLLKQLDSADVQSLYTKALPIIEYNYNHFYDGGFEAVLKSEFIDMLENIKRDNR